MTKLREARQKANINMRQATEIFQVPYRTWQDWEHGKRHCNNVNYYVDALEAIAILTDPADLLDGILTLEDVMHEKKLADVRKMSKIGEFGDMFQANLDRVPEALVEKLTAAELAELVDAIYKAYSDGKNA